jgi:hypothetical protein
VAVATWALGSAMAFFVVHQVDGSDTGTPPSASGSKMPGMLGSSMHAFFSAGWRSGLAVFGMSVDHWWDYALLAAYQLTRSVLGSMVTNIFIPFYAATMQETGPVSVTTRNWALTGRGLTSVFTMWSTLTDILLSASQFDLFLLTVLASVSADTGYGVLRIVVRSRDAQPPAAQPNRSAPSAQQHRAAPSAQQHRSAPAAAQPAGGSSPGSSRDLQRSSSAGTRRRSTSPGTKAFDAVQIVYGN